MHPAVHGSYSKAPRAEYVQGHCSRNSKIINIKFFQKPSNIYKFRFSDIIARNISRPYNGIFTG